MTTPDDCPQCGSDECTGGCQPDGSTWRVCDEHCRHDVLPVRPKYGEYGCSSPIDERMRSVRDDIPGFIPPGTRWYFTSDMRTRTDITPDIPGAEFTIEPGIGSSAIPPGTQVHILRNEPGVPYSRVVHSSPLKDWSLGEHIRTHMVDITGLDVMHFGNAYMRSDGAPVSAEDVRIVEYNSEPTHVPLVSPTGGTMPEYTVHKYGAYIQIHDEEAYIPHSPSHLSRSQRVRYWIGDTRYKIRMRLASWIAGFDVEDLE